MKILEITPQNASQELTAYLDGKQTVLVLEYTSRHDTWSIGIQSDEGEYVTGPVPCDPGVNLFRKNPSKHLPPGILVFLDSSQNASKPVNWVTLGKEMFLHYIEYKEIRAYANS